MFEAFLEAKTAFLKLTHFLVAQRHVVEQLQGVGLVPVIFSDVDNVQHAMSFLE